MRHKGDAAGKKIVLFLQPPGECKVAVGVIHNFSEIPELASNLIAPTARSAPK